MGRENTNEIPRASKKAHHAIGLVISTSYSTRNVGRELTQVRWERQYSNETESYHNREQTHVPPGRGFSVLLHHLHVDIRFLFGTISELLPDLLSMIEVGVYDQRSDGRK
jgi:hypothetical protein